MRHAFCISNGKTRNRGTNKQHQSLERRSSSLGLVQNVAVDIGFANSGSEPGDADYFFSTYR